MFIIIIFKKFYIEVRGNFQVMCMMQIYQWIDSLPRRKVGFDVSSGCPLLETSNLVFCLGGEPIH